MVRPQIPPMLWSPPSPHSHRRLSHLYYFISRYLLKYPDESVYKRSTKAIIDHRKCIIEATDDISEIESRICCGSIKQLIQQAENELALCKTLFEYKPWEPLANYPPEDQWKWPIVEN